MKANFYITDEEGTAKTPFFMCNEDEVNDAIQWLRMYQELELGKDYTIIYEKQK